MIAAAYEHYLFFCETMKNAGLTNYVYELDFLQRPLSRMSKFQLMYYNKLKKYYQKAIRDIYDAAPYNGAVALMKGFAEDEDLYSEYFRTYNDIDLLIDEENIYPFIENLASLGYSFSDKPLNASNVQYDLSVSAHQAHIDPIFKKYGNITVCIEIHTVLKNTWKQLKEYNNMDLTKTVMRDVLPLDSGYYVLSPVDRFVFGLVISYLITSRSGCIKKFFPCRFIIKACSMQSLFFTNTVWKTSLKKYMTEFLCWDFIMIYAWRIIY